jgi:3-methyladenine DNA glycosylase/8-oxoguanine DNA glycosylase
MARLVAQLGPIEIREDSENPFRSLCRSIIFQQLSGKAAGTIFARFVQLFDGGATTDTAIRRSNPAWEPPAGPFPEPRAVLSKDDETLRAAGLSRQKIASLRSLAEHFSVGELGSEAFDHWADDEIVAHLTRVRGIGRWTAEMFLIFHLQRPDVLPVNDVGINRAIARQYELEGIPGAEDVLRIGALWRPHATAACLYLWRSEDVAVPSAG